LMARLNAWPPLFLSCPEKQAQESACIVADRKIVANGNLDRVSAFQVFRSPTCIDSKF